MKLAILGPAFSGKTTVFNALTGRTVRKLGLGDHFEAASPAFSPDGQRVAFTWAGRGLATMDLTGGDRDVLSVEGWSGSEK